MTVLERQKNVSYNNVSERDPRFRTHPLQEILNEVKNPDMYITLQTEISVSIHTLYIQHTYMLAAAIYKKKCSNLLLVLCTTWTDSRVLHSNVRNLLSITFVLPLYYKRYLSSEIHNASLFSSLPVTHYVSVNEICLISVAGIPVIKQFLQL